MKKSLIILISAIVLVLILLSIFLILKLKLFEQKEEYPNFLLHEERINISLPYAKEDEVIGLVPLGETVYHPVAGHPGIDFGWDHNAPIRASADGTIENFSKIETREHENVNLILRSGQYFIEYGGLEYYNHNLSVGSSVKKGDIIGYPGAKKGSNYAIHWEIKPAYPNSERLCPLTYFDNESKERIEKIWKTAIWDHRTEFPDICNGRWKNLNSFTDLIKWLDSPEKIKLDEDLRNYKESNPEKF